MKVMNCHENVSPEGVLLCGQLGNNSLDLREKGNPMAGERKHCDP